MGTSKEVTFRKMTPEDSDAVAEIENKCFAMPWKRDDFYKYSKEKHIDCIVGEIDKKIVAYALIFISFNESDVLNIAVDPNFQNRGIGTKLFAEIIRNVKNRGVTSITLEVRPSNIPARSLYEKFGLRIVGVRKKYYADNDEDALVMWNTHL